MFSKQIKQTEIRLNIKPASFYVRTNCLAELSPSFCKGKDRLDKIRGFRMFLETSTLLQVQHRALQN